MQQQQQHLRLPEKYDPVWRALNDRQVEQARLREQQEQLANQRLRSNYKDQLVKLIEQRQRQKHEQVQNEKHFDHHLVERSLQIQKRNYEIEQLRQRELNEISSKIDRDNEAYENYKKLREKSMKIHENQMMENAFKQTEEELKRERQFEDYKKIQMKKAMEESLEIKELNRRRQKMTEGEYDRRVMEEQRRILMKIDSERNKYLGELRAKAQQIDPHQINDIYKSIHDRQVQQKRKEDLTTFKDAINIQHQHKQLLQQDRAHRLHVQNLYRHELKQQMTNKEISKYQDKTYEMLSDRNQMIQKMEMSRQEQEYYSRLDQAKKAEYLQFLKKQAEEVKEIRTKDFRVSPLEMQLNKPLLQGQPTQPTAGAFIPGSYRSIDHQRRRQLSILQKSVGSHARTNSAAHNTNKTISYDASESPPPIISPYHPSTDRYFQLNARRLLN